MKTDDAKPAQTMLQRSELLGFFTHPGTKKQYLERIESSIKGGNFSTIYYHNLHTVYVYLSDAEFRRSYRHKTVLIDGMVLLFVYRLAGYRYTREYRVTYVEFVFPLMELARDRGWRVFHIGQSQDTLNTAINVIKDRVPGIEICGHHGYFDTSHSSDESIALIEQVNNFSADIVLVGLGSPKQEHWVDIHREKLNAGAVLTCGSCMDYVAGKVNAAPRWLSRMGLEAVYRVYADPKRLAYRYLIEPILLVKILLMNKFRNQN